MREEGGRGGGERANDESACAAHQGVAVATWMARGAGFSLVSRALPSGRERVWPTPFTRRASAPAPVVAMARNMLSMASMKDSSDLSCR